MAEAIAQGRAVRPGVAEEIVSGHVVTVRLGGLLEFRVSPQRSKPRVSSDSVGNPEYLTHESALPPRRLVHGAADQGVTRFKTD